MPYYAILVSIHKYKRWEKQSRIVFANCADKLCWKLDDDEIMQYMEEDYEGFLSAMYSLYKAIDVMFAGETQLAAARALSTIIFENETTVEILKNNSAMANLQDQVYIYIYI